MRFHFYSVLAITLCLLLGYITYAYFSIIPASLYGMFYFAIALHLGVIKSERVSATVSWIIKHMGVCFVPAGIGIMNYFDLLKANGWLLLLFTILSTIVLMILVGWMYQKLQQRGEE